MEDVYGGGDGDYNDVLFYLDLGDASEGLKYVNAPGLGGVSLEDVDSSVFLGATVEIANGYVAGDKLVLEGYNVDINGDIAGTTLVVATTITDGILTLTLTGNANTATYESVLNALRLVNDGEGSDISGTREISISVTDTEGASTIINTAINITADPTTGTDSAETITGTASSDSIYGKDGDDVIDAGDGSDIINGGSGADILTGGAGADSFDFSFLTDSTSTNRDIITDFVQGADTLNFIQLAQFGIINFASVTVTNDGSNTLVAANDSDFEVELSGVFNLDENDFAWG